MITAVIGHRGTGKTELIKRLQYYVNDPCAVFIDLDKEIEDKIGKSIHELFLQHGESYFRDLEKQLFFEILQKPYANLYLVLGAGFDASIIPDNIHVLMIKRKTDLDGRIFLDRPRLNLDLSPLEEYRKRAEVREQRFLQRADEIYLMPEGQFENHHHAMAVEKSILTHSLKDIKGVCTVLPSFFRTPNRWDSFKQRYGARGVSYFELRDDLLSKEQILQTLHELPDEHFIYSFRINHEWPEFWEDMQNMQILNQVTWIDWAIELGSPDEALHQLPKEKFILSLHDSDKEKEWQKYAGSVGHLKYAPEISTFKDLERGHVWQSQDSAKRSFLPRSKKGRWEWYRLLQKEKQLLNFWRDGEGSAEDQPSLFSWLLIPEGFKKFAAVLGDPVSHSFTPLEHSDFFVKRRLPVFAINIAREEWEEALPVIERLGLMYAAVTSPHKENAAKLCHHPELKSVNTLYLHEKKQCWVGTSTDEKGFLELIEGVGMISPLQNDIFVWGGGGTLEIIEKALPNAKYFSSRTGDLRTNLKTFVGKRDNEVSELHPKIVVWAAPRTDETLMPPATWKPVMVYDLNYKEDSLGREYAQKCGANYQSGLIMFISQAQGQRVFWSQCEEQV